MLDYEYKPVYLYLLDCKADYSYYLYILSKGPCEYVSIQGSRGGAWGLGQMLAFAYICWGGGAEVENVVDSAS